MLHSWNSYLDFDQVLADHFPFPQGENRKNDQSQHRQHQTGNYGNQVWTIGVVDQRDLNDITIFFQDFCGQIGKAPVLGMLE